MAVTRKVVAIGPRDELLYLKGVGADFVPVEVGEDLEEPLRRHARTAAVGLTIVSETVAEGRHDIIADVRRATGAVVLVVPSYKGGTESTLLHMRHVLEQSIGVDLLSDE